MESSIEEVSIEEVEEKKISFLILIECILPFRNRLRGLRKQVHTYELLAETLETEAGSPEKLNYFPLPRLHAMLVLGEN